MKPHLEEAELMLRLADRDLAAFHVLCRADEIHFSIVCFHAQQVIEKCLKAALFCRRIAFRRTHDLAMLSGLLLEHQVALPLSADELASLNPCAVMFRYDDVEFEIATLSPATLAEMVISTRRWADDVYRDAQNQES
jgi:HEPN domain-containing protein